MCIAVLPACVSVCHIHALPSEARESVEISWDWGSRQLWVPCRFWVLNPIFWKNIKCSYLLSRFSSCWNVVFYIKFFFNFYFLNKQWAKPTFFSEKIWSASWICIFSVCRGHANFSVAPILVCVLPKQTTEHFLEALLITFSFWNRASCILGCPWTCDIAKNDLAFLTFSAPTSWVLEL